MELIISVILTMIVTPIVVLTFKYDDLKKNMEIRKI